MSWFAREIKSEEDREGQENLNNRMAPDRCYK